MKPQPHLSTQEVLAGLVERVTFHNTENGFCALRALSSRVLGDYLPCPDAGS